MYRLLVTVSVHTQDLEGVFTTITWDQHRQTGSVFRKEREISYADHADCGSDKMALDPSDTWESLQANKAFTKLVREGTVSAA